MLKIQSGSARGRIIKSLSDAPYLRPILARVKKSLFDIIKPIILDSEFLDLYSGTGAVGLEALSRGAKHVHFVEKDRRCQKVLRENLSSFGFESQAHIFSLTLPHQISQLPKPYDLIFMGPPYKDEEKNPLTLVTPTLAEIYKGNLLKKGGLTISQHHKKEEVQLPTETWELFRQERYGDTVLSFVRWKK